MYKVLFYLVLIFLVAAEICALGVAEFNLYGVPMLERSAMNPLLGWYAVAFFVLGYILINQLLKYKDWFF